MNNWPRFEVFIRSKNGLNHKHVGSLHASDAHMAIQNARDVYTRRSEGVSIWVVEAKHITASNPDDSEALFDPAEAQDLSSSYFLGIAHRTKTHVILWKILRRIIYCI